MRSLILVILFIAPAIICDRFILGGQPIEIEEAPYVVAILKRGDFHCTGALISHEYAITSGDCVQYQANYTIRIGSKDKLSGGLIVNVEKVFVHPKFNDRFGHEYDYDFALLLLRDVEKFPDVVQFIPLPDENDETEVGEMMQIAGWGETQSENESRQYLRGAFVPIFDFTKCQDTYWWWRVTVTDRMVCAGFKEWDIDTCRGDSGGGMKRVSDGVLIGIASFERIACNWAGYPGIYAKVSAVRDWIREITFI